MKQRLVMDDAEVVAWLDERGLRDHMEQNLVAAHSEKEKRGKLGGMVGCVSRFSSADESARAIVALFDDAAPGESGYALLELYDIAPEEQAEAERIISSYEHDITNWPGDERFRL